MKNAPAPRGPVPNDDQSSRPRLARGSPTALQKPLQILAIPPAERQVLIGQHRDLVLAGITGPHLLNAGDIDDLRLR